MARQAKREGRPFTRDELSKAEKLHDSGLKWDIVAEAIGHPRGSLLSTRTAIKKGRHKRTLDERRAESLRRMSYVEVLIELGSKPKEIARLLKISGSNLSNQFALWGLDREMRNGIRIESDPEIQVLVGKIDTWKVRTDRHFSNIVPTVRELLRKTEMTVPDLAKRIGCRLHQIENALERY